MDQLRKRFKDEGSVGTACIYCDYKRKDEQTVVNLIAGLWMQLVQDRGALPNDVNDLYKRHINRRIRPTLEEVSSILQSEVSRYSKVFIVVDALDECTEDDRSRASLLMELHGLQPTVNLMVTSRFVDNIAHEFKGTTSLEVSACFEDVRAYIVGEMSRNRQLSRYIGEDAALGDEMVETVAGNVRKMYEIPIHDVYLSAAKSTLL